MNRLLYNVFIILTVLTLMVASFNCLVAKPITPDSTENDNSVSKEIDIPPNIPRSPADQFASDKIFIDSIGNKIDYSDPKLYLTSGIQSFISQKYFKEISKQLIIGGDALHTIGAIFEWKRNYFQTSDAGGKLIGKITVDQIIEEKILTGCHDHGLVLASVLRKYGFPAIMVDTAGIQWAVDYSKGKQTGYKGHVFIEVYMDGEWILINSTSGKYINNYEPLNPVIPMPDSAESKGYFALFKGLDPADYGINSNEKLKENLNKFANKFDVAEISFPPYKFNMLP